MFSPKDKIGDWLEMYTKIMELNYWTQTEALSATYDEVKQEWEVLVNRNGEQVTLRPKQLVLATGMSGIPNMPNICLLYTSPSPRDRTRSRMPSSA